MSWINTQWEDPEEGKVYDVWSKEYGRQMNITYTNGQWVRFVEKYGNIDCGTITHFMPSPEPPAD